MSDILLSPAQADPAILPLQNRPLASAWAETAAIPWTIWCVFSGIVITLVGGSWDFAWHMSIGRETFWTPAHIMVQLGGIMVGIAAAYTVLSTTFGSASAQRREVSVRMLGLHGPAGALLALWGAVAMVSSAPFDNWWHNAYGLDVKLVTPPHMWLSLGWFATKIGAMTWMAALINRSTEAVQTRLTWLLLIVGGICVGHLGVLSLDPTQLRLMHTAYCYLAVAIFNPTMLIGTGRGSRRRWGCTLVAVMYTALGLAAEWILPLIPAQPKLGPVYQKVTHLIPLKFPLLLIVPAFVADLLLQRLEKRPAWIKSLIVGPAFVLSFMAVQWPFANFLITPASRNWIFGTAYFPYFEPAGILYDPYKLRATEKPVAFAITMFAALAISVVTTRLGVAWGDWMRRVRR